MAMAMIACAGCRGRDSTEATANVARWVVQQGGTVRLEGRTKEISVADDLPSDPFQIDRISLNETSVRDEQLQQLTALKNLRSLSLYRTGVTDAGLEHLAGLTGLEELELSYTGVTDTGLARLMGLTRLKKLYLYGTSGSVTDEGVKTVQKALPNVKIIR